MALFNRIRQYNLVDTKTNEVKGTAHLTAAEAKHQNNTVIKDSNGGRAWVQNEWDHDPADDAVAEFLSNL
jgi:hypothetical protein